MFYFLNGYARSGKSSVITELEKRDFACFSTSDFLNDITVIFIKTAYQTLITNSLLKEMLLQKTDNLCLDITGYTCREIKIAVAEKFLIPIYGRKNAIVAPVIYKALNQYKEGYDIVFETIGGEEYKIAKSLLEIHCVDAKNVATINLQSEEQLEDVDIRKPFKHPDKTVYFEPNYWYSEDFTQQKAYRDSLISAILE